MLRVLEVNKAYAPHVGGIETLVQQYSEGLLSRGDVHVQALVCRDSFGKTIHDCVNGVSVTRAGSFGTYFSCPVSLSFVLTLRKIANDFDVIHIHMPFPLADAAMLVSGFKGRVVLTWHSDIVKQKKLMYLYKPFMLSLLKRADCILAATKGHIINSEQLWRFRKKCRILPFGIAPEKYLTIERKPFLTERLTDKNAVKVFFTGRLVYYKGVDVLLKAFRKVKGCELFIAGTGELEAQLKDYVRRCGMSSRVHFLGFLPDDELKQAYADCDIFVLPSVERSEAFGIVQIEAMIYGKPVINTALPSGVPYVSIHGKTGLTVPPSDARALAGAIEKLAGSPELREKYGAAAAERVKKVFGEKEAADRLYRLLSENTGKEAAV